MIDPAALGGQVHSHAPATQVAAARAGAPQTRARTTWLSTPVPWVNLALAVAGLVGIGALWAFDRHYSGADKVLLTALILLLMALEAAPGVWTLRHRDEARAYQRRSSRRWYAGALKHPYLVLLGTPPLGFLYGFLRGVPHHGHASIPNRLATGALAAAVVAAIGAFRVLHARKALARYDARP